MSVALPLPPSNTPYIDPQTGSVSEVWKRYELALQNAIVTTAAPTDAKYLVGTSNPQLSDDINLGALTSGHLSITVAAGTAAVSSSATVPAADLSGTISDARLSSNVPLKNGTNAFTGANTFPAGGSPSTIVPSGRVFSITSAAPTTGTVEEVLATYTMVGATLNANGQALRFAGNYTTAANGNNKIIRMRVGGIGGTIILTYTSATNNGTVVWESWLTRRTATTGYGAGWASDGATTTTIGAAITPTFANDTDIVITGQTATAAGDMTLQQAIGTYQG